MLYCGNLGLIGEVCPKIKQTKDTGVKRLMEKCRMHPVKSGNGQRMTFARHQEVLEIPNLIDIQKNSYQWFLVHVIFLGITTVLALFEPLLQPLTRKIHIRIKKKAAN